jgi:hypothetical protein
VGGEVRCEPGDFVRQALGVERVGGDDDQHASAAGQPGNGQGVTRSGKGRQVKALAWLGLAEDVEGREEG